MKSADISALVAYRMQRAEDSLEAAKIMAESGMLGFAMNRDLLCDVLRSTGGVDPEERVFF